MPLIPVICPSNAGPGSQLEIQGPTGERLLVVVPNGVKPGQTFQVNVRGPADPPTVVAVDTDPTRARNPNIFKHDLFGCCDRGIGQCICMSLFWPCAVGTGMTRVRGRGYCGYLIFGGLPITHAHARYKLREQFSLEGELQDDLVMATFCTPCSVCQVLNEIADRTNQDFGLCGCLGQCTDKHLLNMCSCCGVCLAGMTSGCRSCCKQCCCDL